MAKNVTVQGASYTGVPAVNLPQTGGGTATFTDVTDTTATASDVASGKYFYAADGVKTLGTASGGAISVVDTPDASGGTIRTITAVDISDTTAIASDVASGKYFYAADGTKTLGTASGGGGSSWTKVCEKSYTTSTTSTSAVTLDTWATGHSEIWTSDKILYVRVRDTAGKRNGYFYGSDNFFLMRDPMYGTVLSSYFANGLHATLYSSSSGYYNCYSSGGTTAYGVYADTIYSDGQILIKQRYHSSRSLTINGTYKVEVYLLDPPTGSPLFE